MRVLVLNSKLILSQKSIELYNYYTKKNLYTSRQNRLDTNKINRMSL